MRLISRFVSLLLTPLLLVHGLPAQAPGGSASVAQDAAQDLQIRVVASDASGTARLIEVTNANGVGIADVAVVFRLPDSGPTGTFSDGTHAAVAYTDQGGRAAIPSIQWDSTAGKSSIRVSATKGTAHAGILVDQNRSGGSAGPELIPGIVPLPTPPPAPVQQPGSIARVSGIPEQAPTPEPKVSITSATPQSEAHSGKTKWIVIAAIAVGAGVGVAMAMKGKSSSSTTAATGLSIGAPSGGGSVGAPPH